MLEKLRETYDEVVSGSNYLEWMGEHSSAFLSGAFLQEDWQLDFYDPSKEVVGSFFRGGLTEDRMFKRPDEDVHELKLKDVKVDLEDAFKVIKESLSKKGEQEQKRIVILQNNQGKDIWNITIISTLFNIINFKIDAVNGELISESHQSPLSFRG